MMSLFKKKKFKFRVELRVGDLCDVPLVSNHIFAKVRLLQGGSFAGQTRTVPVVNHKVNWSEEFVFTVRIASDDKGYLLPTLCRVSVRKETKGGKTFEKLGFADIDLSFFAGSGNEGNQQSFLLEGYRAGARQDNSRLNMNIAMHLQSSDPHFKVPRHGLGPSTSAQEELNPLERKAPGAESAGSEPGSSGDRHSVVSLNSSSGFGSVTRDHPTNDVDIAKSELCSLAGHSRNASSTSHSSGCNGNRFHHHSRQNSVDGHKALLQVGVEYRRGTTPHTQTSPGSLVAPMGTPGHDRRPSADVKYASLGPQSGARMANTRVDAEDVISDILQANLLHDIRNVTSTDEGGGGGGGLALYVSADGSAALGSDDMPHQLGTTSTFRKPWTLRPPLPSHGGPQTLLFATARIACSVTGHTTPIS